MGTPSLRLAPTVLVTGAGSAPGLGCLQSLEGHGFELFAADVSRFAAGLFLVPEENRICLPPGDSPEFLPAVLEACASHRIDVLVPTVDDELLRLAEARRSLERLGTSVLVPDPEAVAICTDLLVLMDRFCERVPTPTTATLDRAVYARSFRFPLTLRCRSSSQEESSHVLLAPEDLEVLVPDPAFVVQEYLGGAEYEVQVLGDRNGAIQGVVPVTTVGGGSCPPVGRRTLRRPLVEGLARTVYRELGLRGPAAIDFREDRFGRPHLVGVHPRLGAGALLAATAGVPLAVNAVRELLGQPGLPILEPIAEVASVSIPREIPIVPRSLDAQPGDFPAEMESIDDSSEEKHVDAEIPLLLH